MKEWSADEAIATVKRVLLKSDFAKETDMIEDEAEALAETIIMNLEDTP